MSNDNSQYQWTPHPVLHFGNVGNYKTRNQQAIEFYEKQIEDLKEKND